LYHLDNYNISLNAIRIIIMLLERKKKIYTYIHLENNILIITEFNLEKQLVFPNTSISPSIYGSTDLC
jgi:hypothetical protein